MARIRTLKPDAWHDERLGQISRDARLLWVVLITQADDEGRFRATPSIVHGAGYPYDLEALGLLPGWLDELARVGLVELYGKPVAGRLPYGTFPRWTSHQRISKPTSSKLPEPPGDSQGSPGNPAPGGAGGADSPSGTDDLPDSGTSLGIPGEPSPRARGGEVEEEGDKEEEVVEARAPAAAPASPPGPPLALTCPTEVRDMLLAAEFDVSEIEHADSAIRLTLNQLRDAGQLPDDVDWPAFSKRIVHYRRTKALKRKGPCAALRFVAKSADGAPRLSAAQRQRREQGGRSFMTNAIQDAA